jgi:hypothetical protein
MSATTKLYMYSLPYSTEKPMLGGVMLDGELVDWRGERYVQRPTWMGRADGWHETKELAYREAAARLRDAARKIEAEAARLDLLADNAFMTDLPVPVTTTGETT